MRNKFWGFIPPSEDDFIKLWKEASFFIDANILLDLYRYSSDSRDKSFKLLEDLKERVYITEISLSEFFKHRQDTYYENRNIKMSLCQDIDFKEIKNKINSVRNSMFENEKAINIVEKFEEDLNKYLDNIEKKIGDNGDKTLDKIVNLFGSNVIENFDQKKLEELYKVGEYRFENQIPPGFKDIKKKGNEKYNDFITWEIMIQYAKEKNKHIIFVTEDAKEDWIKQIKGKKVGPREDLLNEFYKRSEGKMIYIYSTEGLIKGYNRYIEKLDYKLLIKEYEQIIKDKEDIDNHSNAVEKIKFNDSYVYSIKNSRMKYRLLKQEISEIEKDLEELVELRNETAHFLNIIVNDDLVNNSMDAIIEKNLYQSKLNSINEKIINMQYKLAKNIRILESLEQDLFEDNV